MKFSTMMAVFAVALAVAATGCRYNKANGGAGEGANGGAGDDALAAQRIDGEGEDIEVSDDDEANQSGSLDGIDEKRFEDYCTPCTDVNFAPVYFGFDSTVVPQGELGKIDAVAQHLADNAGRVVVIEGNCDERGSNEYNVSLGEGRAIILRNYLVQNGVKADRIQTRSNGEEKPAVEGNDESAWSKNRRGEFVIFQK